MFNELCDDAHEAHALQVIHRVVVVIAVCFAALGTFAVVTRFGHGAPPASVAYGTEQPAKGAVVLNAEE